MFLAFAGTYFRNVTFSGKAMTVVLQVHTALMMLWVLMLIAQAWFIRTKRMAAHRWVGRSSYVIAPAIIVAALLTMRDDLVRAAVDGVLQNAQVLCTDLGRSSRSRSAGVSRSCIAGGPRCTCGT